MLLLGDAAGPMMCWEIGALQIEIRSRAMIAVATEKPGRRTAGQQLDQAAKILLACCCCWTNEALSGSWCTAEC